MVKVGACRFFADVGRCDNLADQSRAGNSMGTENYARIVGLANRLQAGPELGYAA